MIQILILSYNVEVEVDVRGLMTNKLTDVRVITRLVVCVMGQLELHLRGYKGYRTQWNRCNIGIIAK